MVIDTSALIAVLLNEPERLMMLGAIVRDRIRLLSAISLFETTLVSASRKGQSALFEVTQLIEALAIEIRPFTRDQARLAQDAWFRFGKGRHRRD